MKSFEALIEDLKSPDSAIRDLAALDLMDIGDINAVQPLIEAISIPENENYRGTLVYALSAFSCEEHLEFLVDLTLTGNFEVSLGAFSIIEKIELTSANTNRIRIQVNRYSAESLPYEHSNDARLALLDIIQSDSE